MVCTDAMWNESGLIAGLEWAFLTNEDLAYLKTANLRNLLLTKVIQKKDFIKELVGILQDIYEPFCCFSSISFIFIPRNINIVADTRAKHALYVSIAGYFILYNNIVPRRSRRIELGNERDETHGLTKECFESDCQQLVRLIQDPKAWLALGPELDEIDSLSSEFTTFSFCFIPRSDNVRAEFLAKACRSLAQNFSFLDDKAPPRLAHETCLFE
ncbi:hypothetical protein F2Q70_00004478 [Brassica cretica]|uniref:Uncharacterized protein n=1 Tax=Brassica cretica TaxID=69181 RepID=A0A3N6QXB8_BRACR|nr:hypothetical protein F2Q70_00004478 [Brassica cretica]